jgi:hypothetical protein
MKRGLPLMLGASMLVAGGIWTLQGLGYLKGSPMTDVAVWAIIGPFIAGLGLALMIVGVRGTQRR